MRGAMADEKRRRQLKTFPGLAPGGSSTPRICRRPRRWPCPASIWWSPRCRVRLRAALLPGEHRRERPRHAEHVPAAPSRPQVGGQILDVAEPELYVTMDPVPNAFTYGHKSPFIVITSGLVDMLDDEELSFVVGHEWATSRPATCFTGSWRATSPRRLADRPGDARDRGAARSGPGLRLARVVPPAELTADRAGFLCVQDLDPCLTVFMKLAGARRGCTTRSIKDEFLRQIREFEDADRSSLNRAYKMILTASRTHPFPICARRRSMHGTAAVTPS